MCGRYTLTRPAAALDEEFSVHTGDLVATPRYNIAPTQPVLIVLERRARAARSVRWGLWPSWLTDLARAPLLINARAESLAERPAFRAALRTQRCLVPADGFYEWRKLDGGKKQAYYVRRRDERAFAFAGLWELWRDEAGKAFPSCAIVTVPPNAVMAPIHDRMPAILEPQAYEPWLSPRLQAPAEVLPLLRPFASDELVAFPVSSHVNAAHHEDPRCITPLNADS